MHLGLAPRCDPAGMRMTVYSVEDHRELLTSHSKH